MSSRELWMRDVLADLLDTDRAEVSVTRSFAELGLDSLTGLRFARKLQDQFAIEIELEWIFDYPSIRQLAEFLDVQFGTAEAIGISAG